MKTYTIKHSFNGYELINCETKSIIAIFRFVHGFYCLQDVVDYVLENFDTFKIRVRQLKM